MHNNDILKRYERTKSDRQNIEKEWDDISTLVHPFKGNMYLKQGSAELSMDWRENRSVFDSTAIDCAQKLSANIHAKLTGAAARWFNLRFRDDKLNRDREAKEWLDDTTERVYQELLESNFELAAAEVYEDMVAYGTSACVEEVESETDWTGLDFSTIPIKELFFEEDTRGDVVNLYRRHYWSPMQMTDKFGDDKVPKNIAQKAKLAGAGQEKKEVVFAIFKRPDKANADISKPLAADQRPFGWKYILKETGETLGDEGGYYEMPAFLPRWRTTPDSQWGNSPSMQMLPTIKSLNVLMELHEKALEKVVDPTILASEKAVISNLLLGAGEVNVVRDVEGVRPFESRANFPAIYQMITDMRTQIRDAYYIDQLTLKETPAMTATEVSARYEMMQQTLGATVSRIKSHFLDPLIQRTVRIMSRAGRLEAYPQSVIDTQSELDIEYVGPLNRSQKRDVVQSIDEVVLSAAQMAEVNPEILDNVDFDEVIRKKAQLLGAPAMILKDEDTVEMAREQRKQQMEQQQGIANAEQVGKTVRDMGAGLKSINDADAGAMQ